MEKPRKVAVLFGRSVAIAIKTAIILETVRPVFQRERRIGHRKVKALQHLIVGTIFKIVWRGECVSCLNLTGGLIVQNEIHFCKTGGGNFLFLSPNGNLKGSFIRCADQKRTGAAGRVYQSGVFDTCGYECKYGKRPINKDFRGVSPSQKSLFQ